MLFAHNGFVGFGDAIDTNDPCSINPSDPICVAHYGGTDAANKAAVSSTVDTNPNEIVFGVDPNDCRAGTTWDPTRQICAPNPATNWLAPLDQLWTNFASWAGPSATITSPAAAAVPKVSLKAALVVVAIAVAGFSGYHFYEKRKRSK